MNFTKNYSTNMGADEVQILEGLEEHESVPGMYIGSTSSTDFIIWYMIVDNAVDEEHWQDSVILF